MTGSPAEDRDDRLIVAYARGELDERARGAFECRLADEPELVARYEQFLELDLIGEALSATTTNAGTAGQERRSWQRKAAGVLALAAAAACVVFWLRTRANDLRFEARAVATVGADSLAEYGASIGVPEPERVPGDARRGAEHEMGAVRTAAEYLQAVREAESERNERVFSSEPRRVEAEFVTIRFRATTTCSAVVVQLDSRGRLRRRFPSPEGVFVFREAANHFDPGRIHMLPRPVAVETETGEISAHPGFDVPSDLPVPVVWLLLALRKDGVPPPLLMELDSVLERSSGAIDMSELAGLPPAEQEALANRALAGVRDWLDERGFTLQRFSVRLPP